MDTYFANGREYEVVESGVVADGVPFGCRFRWFIGRALHEPWEPGAKWYASVSVEVVRTGHNLIVWYGQGETEEVVRLGLNLMADGLAPTH